MSIRYIRDSGYLRTEHPAAAGAEDIEGVEGKFVSAAATSLSAAVAQRFDVL